MTPRHARRHWTALYSLGIPINFRRDHVTGTVPGASQQNTAELDFGAVAAVRLAQVKYINSAIIGEGHDGLRGLLVATAAHAECGPRSCIHKTKSSDIGDLHFAPRFSGTAQPKLHLSLNKALFHRKIRYWHARSTWK